MAADEISSGQQHSVPLLAAPLIPSLHDTIHRMNYALPAFFVRTEYFS
jgi:hypothetical protein